MTLFGSNKRVLRGTGAAGAGFVVSHFVMAGRDRPSTSYFQNGKDVDARDERGHDDG
jgi:hypothetical protein